MTHCSLFLRLGALGLMAGAVAPARAQTVIPGIPYNAGNAVQQAEQAQRPPIARPAQAPVLPQLVEPLLTLKDKETLLVKHFEIDGPALVDAETLRAIVAPFENRKLTLAEIYRVADRITTLYRTQGFILAKAYVPAQDARKGTLRIKLLAGSYGAITVHNQSPVRDDFLQSQIGQALGDPSVVRRDALERAMLLVSDLPGAGMPRVAIGPGQGPGTSDFLFNVPEGRRVDGYLLADNYGPSFTGRDRLSGAAELNSPFGYGDKLSIGGIVSDQTELVNGIASYSAPLFYDGLRGEISAFHTTYSLGGLYQSLDATGWADGISGTVTYAVLRQREESFYVAATFTHRALTDKALGVSYASRTIDLGTVSATNDAAGTLSGLPFTTNAALSLTVGDVNFADPTQKALNQAGADTAGTYERINFSAQGTLALSERLSLSTLLKAQKALSRNLDSSEQFSLTGIWGVRSFDEGFTGDSGYLVTPDLKYALPDFNTYRHAVGVFTDIGGVWLENASYTVTQKPFTQLNDVGLGYYATLEYTPGRFLLLKAQVAHTYGSDSGATLYDGKTKGLVQVGFTF